MSKGSQLPPEVEVGEAHAQPGQPSTSSSIEILSFEREGDTDVDASATTSTDLPSSSSVSSGSSKGGSESLLRSSTPLGSSVVSQMMLGKTQAVLKLGGIMRRSECLLILASGLSESAASMMPDGLPSALRGGGGGGGKGGEAGGDAALSGHEGRLADVFSLPSRMEKRLMRIVDRPMYPQSLAGRSNRAGPGLRASKPLISSSGGEEGAGGGVGGDLVFDPQSDFPPQQRNGGGGSAAETFGIVIEVGERRRFDPSISLCAYSTDYSSYDSLSPSF